LLAEAFSASTMFLSILTSYKDRTKALYGMMDQGIVRKIRDELSFMN
jgi:hypothetical protein